MYSNKNTSDENMKLTKTRATVTTTSTTNDSYYDNTDADDSNSSSHSSIRSTKSLTSTFGHATATTIGVGNDVILSSNSTHHRHSQQQGRGRRRLLRGSDGNCSSIPDNNTNGNKKYSYNNSNIGPVLNFFGFATTNKKCDVVTNTSFHRNGSSRSFPTSNGKINGKDSYNHHCNSKNSINGVLLIPKSISSSSTYSSSCWIISIVAICGTIFISYITSWIQLISYNSEFRIQQEIYSIRQQQQNSRYLINNRMFLLHQRLFSDKLIHTINGTTTYIDNIDIDAHLSSTSADSSNTTSSLEYSITTSHINSNMRRKFINDKYRYIGTKSILLLKKEDVYFHKTVRSCIPAIDGKRKCAEYIPLDYRKQYQHHEEANSITNTTTTTSSNNNRNEMLVQRVAIITPPGFLHSTTMLRIQKVIDGFNNNRHINEQFSHYYDSNKNNNNQQFTIDSINDNDIGNSSSSNRITGNNDNIVVDVDNSKNDKIRGKIRRQHSRRRLRQQQSRTSSSSSQSLLESEYLALVQALDNGKTTAQKWKQKDIPQIDLIVTSHVPAYGFGKAHGYTKIIRFVPRPILIQVVDTLYGSLNKDETYTDIVFDDIVSTLRLLLRYHCRLSRVAVHTALYTINENNFLMNPIAETKRITNFLISQFNFSSSYDFLYDSIIEDDYTYYNEDDTLLLDTENSTNSNNGGITDLENDIMFSYINRILYNILFREREERNKNRRMQQIPVLTSKRKNKFVTIHDLMNELNDIVINEAIISNSYTNWPCESFWTIGVDQTNYPTILRPLPKRIVYRLIPDCYTDPYTKCFVPRDVCEANNDPLCILANTTNETTIAAATTIESTSKPK